MTDKDRQYEALAKERDDVERELVAALEIVDRLRADRYRLHREIGTLIGAPDSPYLYNLPRATAAV